MSQLLKIRLPDGRTLTPSDWCTAEPLWSTIEIATGNISVQEAFTYGIGGVVPGSVNNRQSSLIDTNLQGPMLLTRLALPYLRQTKGVVVNVASIAGHVPLPHEAPYCASKWGLRGFTFAVREELRDAGVAVCVVSPGPIATPFVLDDLDHVPDLVFSQPILTAEQVADAVVACALDRRRERALPRSTLMLAKFAATFPSLQEVLRPALEAKGAKVKARLRQQG